MQLVYISISHGTGNNPCHFFKQCLLLNLKNDMKKQLKLKCLLPVCHQTFIVSESSNADVLLYFTIWDRYEYDIRNNLKKSCVTFGVFFYVSLSLCACMNVCMCVYLCVGGWVLIWCGKQFIWFSGALMFCTIPHASYFFRLEDEKQKTNI